MDGKSPAYPFLQESQSCYAEGPPNSTEKSCWWETLAWNLISEFLVFKLENGRALKSRFVL